MQVEHCSLQDWVERVAVNNRISFQRSVALLCATSVQCTQLTF